MEKPMTKPEAEIARRGSNAIYQAGANKPHYADGHCAGFCGWQAKEDHGIFQPSYDRGYWAGCKAREEAAGQYPRFSTALEFASTESAVDAFFAGRSTVRGARKQP